MSADFFFSSLEIAQSIMPNPSFHFCVFSLFSRATFKDFPELISAISF